MEGVGGMIGVVGVCEVEDCVKGVLEGNMETDVERGVEGVFILPTLFVSICQGSNLFLIGQVFQVFLKV